MKKIGKIALKKSDFIVLNSNELNGLKGGERTKLACNFVHKVYECANLEFKCPHSFVTGDCGMLNTVCSKDFEFSTF